MEEIIVVVALQNAIFFHSWLFEIKSVTDFEIGYHRILTCDLHNTVSRRSRVRIPLKP